MPRKRAVNTPDIVSSIASVSGEFFLACIAFDSSCSLFSALEDAPSRKSPTVLLEVDAHPDEIADAIKMAISLVFIYFP